jgi:hypothetical protein
VQAAFDAAARITAAYKENHQIQSPSKVFQRLGEYTMLGYEIGFENQSKETIAKVGRISQSMIDTFASASVYNSINRLNDGIGASAYTTNQTTLNATINNNGATNYARRDLRAMERMIKRQAIEIAG